MSLDRLIDDEARRLLRSARRRDRLVPTALGVALLYLMSSCWGFLRALGGGGPEVRVQARPTVWGFVAIALVVLLAKVAARVAEHRGASPFAPPRWARRLLIAAAVVLPLLLAAVEPTLAIMTVDSGTLQVPGPHWLISVAATPLR